MRGVLRRTLRAGIGVGALGAFAGCSSSDDRPSKYPCVAAADCAIYGRKTSTCASGTCIGAGLLCSDRAHLDGRARTAGPGSPTVAATFEEFVLTAQSLYQGPFCEQGAACVGTSPGSCGESAPDPQVTGCCKGMLDFYVSHREEIAACSSSVLSCAAPTLRAFCSPLATLLEPGCDRG